MKRNILWFPNELQNILDFFCRWCEMGYFTQTNPIMPLKTHRYWNVCISFILQMYQRTSIVFLGKSWGWGSSVGSSGTFIGELGNKSRLGQHRSSSWRAPDSGSCKLPHEAFITECGKGVDWDEDLIGMRILKATLTFHFFYLFLF